MNIIVKFTPDTTLEIADNIIKKLKGEAIVKDITDRMMALVSITDGLEYEAIEILQKNPLVVYAIMENYEWKFMDQT